MKNLVITIAACLALGTSLAQQAFQPSGRFDLRLNAGTAFTFVPDFNNSMLIAPDGMLIPGFIHPANAASLVMVSEVPSRSESRVGWYAEAEAYYNLSENLNLSFGLGVKKMRFDYTSEVPYFVGMDQFVTVNLDDISRRFGKTDLLYLSITPCNISKQLLQKKLDLQAGPVLNFLLSEKSNNTVLVYDSEESLMINKPDQVYFGGVGNTRKILWGANFSASYKIVEPVAIRISAQYYINSMYKDAAYGLGVEKINPFVLQTGVSVAPFAF